MKNGRQIRAERDARGAGQRGEIGDQFRLVLVGERQRVGEDQPALGIGIADLDRDALARRVDIARPETAEPAIEFSTAGISTRSRTFSPRAMIMCASASAVAAPPISFFIFSIDASGLMSSPPVSKQTPLPTSVTCG